MRDKLTRALRTKYEAQIAEAKVVLDLYMDYPVGVGEHPNILEECDRAIATIAEATEKLQVLAAL